MLRDVYPGRPLEQCVAAQLARTVLIRVRDEPARALELSRRLEAEYLASYGARPPWSVEDMLYTATVASAAPDDRPRGHDRPRRRYWAGRSR
jgi:hypothetical protein